MNLSPTCPAARPLMATFAVAALVAMSAFHPAAAQQSGELVMEILRPQVEGKQVSPTWTELYYIVIDARHPDGIAKLQLYKKGAKKAEKAFSESDRHESGYFLYKRRMKSGGVRDYEVRMWPVGSDPEVDEPIVSERNFPVRYADPDPDLAEIMAFTNLRDREVISANDPGDSEDLTHVFVDCQDASGVWGGGQWKGNRHMGYRDHDGIDWVELVIVGAEGKEKVIRNESAFILDRDQDHHGPYWGEAVNPEHSKMPEEPWSEGIEWKPIEGFGLYHFPISLPPGRYRLEIRAKNREGEMVEGPAIRVAVQPK